MSVQFYTILSETLMRPESLQGDFLVRRWRHGDPAIQTLAI